MSEEQHDYDGIRYREERRSPALFRTLFAGLVVWGVVCGGYYLFSGWSSQSEADATLSARETRRKEAQSASSAAPRTPAADAAKGKQLYAANCAACHGENAKGSVGPDLTASAYKYGKSKADISRSISEGRPGGMPAFGSQYNQEQIEALAEYLLSLK
jgi:cytochrome c oxidase cbb3-type subunit 3